MKKIDSTQRMKIGTFIRVYLEGYGYARCSMIDSSEDFFSVRTDLDFIHHVQDGDKLDAYLWLDESLSYEFTLTVIGRITKYRLLFFDHTSDISFSEERKCVKALVEIPVKFFLFSIPSNDKSFTSSDIEFNRGVITSLSDREAVLSSDIELQEGCFIKGHTRVEGQEADITGKVVSAVPGEEKMYNIEFQGLTEKQRLQILDYIYAVYRE